jgi:tannase
MDKIVNLTIAACDALDGRTDGVVSRTDLCKSSFDLNSTIGESYYCAAENTTSLGFNYGSKRKRADYGGSSSSDQPAQNGTVSAEAAALAYRLWDGLFDSNGDRAYVPWQIASSFEDATTEYDSTTGEWALSIPSTGGEFIMRFVELLDVDNLSSLDNVTYDTVVGWMNTGMIRFMDSLQTTVPDLSDFYNNGGKLLHYHGESDDSVPPASSVHYFDSVRTTMYPNLGYNESVDALGDWYRLFLVPGAAHCSTNSLQPGPYPSSNMDIMIDWVENGVVPTTLNATVSSGDYSGETQQLCAYPLRPLWSDNSTLSCVYDQSSIEAWTFTFPAFKIQPIF